jgi:hypothetical protein
MAMEPGVGGKSSEACEADRSADALISHSISVVRGAYLEIPALHLTRSQVQRLWGLDPDSCDSVLAALIKLQFLEQTPGGAFVRRPPLAADSAILNADNSQCSQL